MPSTTGGRHTHFGLTFVATAGETDGRYFLGEMTVPPGDAGPPPHTHGNETEGFYVLEGALTFLVEGEEFPLGAGEHLNVEPGEEHAWRNDSGDDSRAVVVFAPAGIEEMFVELEEDPGDLVDIGRRYGTEFRVDG